MPLCKACCMITWSSNEQNVYERLKKNGCHSTRLKNTFIHHKWNFGNAWKARVPSVPSDSPL